MRDGAKRRPPPIAGVCPAHAELIWLSEVAESKGLRDAIYARACHILTSLTRLVSMNWQIQEAKA